MIEMASNCGMTKEAVFFRVFLHILHAWEEGCSAVWSPWDIKAMKKFQSRIAPVFILTMVSSVVLVPSVHAQNLGSTVTVSTVPDGAYFSVDGQVYNHAMSAIWPAGSKHVLSVDSNVQNGGATKTEYTFGGWSYLGGALQGNTVTVTADPAFTYYKAQFGLQYALTLVFFTCSDPANCQSPGVVTVNGAPYTYSQDVYVVHAYQPRP